MLIVIQEMSRGGVSQPHGCFQIGCQMRGSNMKSSARGALLAVAAISSPFATSAADAAVVINITQDGNNIALSASGTFDETLATSFALEPTSDTHGSEVFGDIAFVGFGAPGSIDFFNLSGPASFGLGLADTVDNAGTAIGLNGSDGAFFISSAYINNSAISSSASIPNTTISAIGLTPGSYNYLVGQNTVTVNIGGAVPEPGTWAMMLLGFAGIGSAMRRRTWKDNLAQVA